MSAKIIQFPRAPEAADAWFNFWIAFGHRAIALGQHNAAEAALQQAQRLNRERS